MVGLDKNSEDGEYILFLDDGRTARIFVTEDGDLREMIEVTDSMTTDRVPYTELTQDTISFIKARTEREFETE